MKLSLSCSRLGYLHAARSVFVQEVPAARGFSFKVRMSGRILHDEMVYLTLSGGIPGLCLNALMCEFSAHTNRRGPTPFADGSFTKPGRGPHISGDDRHRFIGYSPFDKELLLIEPGTAPPKDVYCQEISVELDILLVLGHNFPLSTKETHN
uniref:Uncharacterized protein n=1 Tax=Timema poppense TaxID=170557 RepID=A0A7R9CRF4_TIMPO|nr:unnamed protein product [Timema poppensis]